MSLSFILGNLLGRALVSYAIVWTVCWLLRRFDWRAASRASLHMQSDAIESDATVSLSGTSNNGNPQGPGQPDSPNTGKPLRMPNRGLHHGRATGAG